MLSSDRQPHHSEAQMFPYICTNAMGVHFSHENSQRLAVQIHFPQCEYKIRTGNLAPTPEPLKLQINSKQEIRAYLLSQVS